MEGDDGKLQTTVGKLLIATAMISAGLVCIQSVYFTPYLLHLSIPLVSRYLETEVLAWLAGAPLIGAGLLLPFNRGLVGAAVGFICQFLVTVALYLFR